MDTDVCIRCHLPFHSSQSNMGGRSEIRVMKTDASGFESGPYHGGCAAELKPLIGCVCPPTSEQTCQNPLCPRKAPTEQ